MEAIDYRRYPILFVDDEEENLEIFRIHFRDTFTIRTAGTAEEGLSVLEQEFVALVLSDQRMPGMTGMEFLREARRRHPEVVTMLITAYSDLDVLAESAGGGELYGYILKPWEPKDLKMALKRGLEHYYLLSERDRLHREQIETLKKMARANKLSAVGTLAAGIAHEIRNPLVSIQTFLELVPQKLAALPLADPGGLDREYWETFHSLSLGEIQRIRRLISELVNLARSPSPPDFQEVDLAEVVAPMVELTRKEADKKGVAIRAGVAPGLPRVRMDRGKIKQALLNLILNALQAVDSGGHVEVEARPGRTAMVEIVVRDQGKGIPPEIQEQVFDPFFTTREAGEGVGLGLTVCHQIVEEHGGEIAIHSEPGRGTEVRLILPVTGPSVE